MNCNKRPFHPILAAGFVLHTVNLLLHHLISLPDFARGFLEGVAVGLLILGAVLTLLGPDRVARMKAWKRRVLFGGNGTC